MKFWIAQKKNVVGNLWGRQVDPCQFKVNRPGDMITIPFQCDTCWYVNLYKVPPVRNAPRDRERLAYIRRVNLDTMWARETSTITNLLSQERKFRRMQEELGLPGPEYPRKGPWPVGDQVGMTTCMVILRASTKSGRYSKSHQQFDTIRRLRTVSTDIYKGSLEGEMASLVLAGDKGKKYTATVGGTESYLFKLFNQGLENRMDKDVRSDLGLSFDLFQEILYRVEVQLQAKRTNQKRRRFLIVFGAYMALSYGGSLRGNEGFFLEGKALLRDINKGKNHTTFPHVVCSLLGKFKGETNEATSTLVLANVSKFGIHFRLWMERLAGLLVSEGGLDREGEHIPAICEETGELMNYGKLNEEFRAQLEGIQASKGLIPKDLCVRQKYRINRSIRRGSRTRAQAVGVREDVVQLVNRWSKIEAKGGRPRLTMYEHYAEIEQLLDVYVIYSQSL